ncbi:MAG: FkbM family methyltransferase [Planctomycetales bacterium]|nr:FkbM family methyltransferase [Planctomycetales bacterium]
MTTSAEHLSQGWRLHQSGDIAAAERTYRQVLAAEPGNANAWCYLGIALFDKQQLEESVAAYQRAVAIQPVFAIAWNNLGNSLRRLHRYKEAIAAYDTALRLDGKYANAFMNRSTALLWDGQLQAGLESVQRALALAPNDLEAKKVLATAKLWLGRLDEAEQEYLEVLKLKPDDAELHKNLSMILLLRGEFQQGWREYSWRQKGGEFGVPSLPGLQWNGSSLNGRTILLLAEQGLGDTIQFIRYAKLLKQKYDCRVVAAVQKPLLTLLKNVAGVDGWAIRGEILPDYDVWAPMLSLPALLGHHDVGDLPREPNYLEADEQLVQKWQEKLAPIGGFKIGIAWQGNPSMDTDRFRSIPLVTFAPLAKISGVKLISLQRGFGTEQLAGVSGRMEIQTLGDDLDTASGPFIDTAAVMKNLDLVITSDTAVAHLAGALGVPVWVALTHVPDWRWFLKREDSPWYPSMRLFRQEQPGEWGAVFLKIAGRLLYEDPRLKVKMPGEYRAADGEINRLIRGRHGLTLYNKHDKYIGRSLELYGEFSQLEVELFEQVVRPGSVVVEAGANIGSHTVPLARLVGEAGRVHAFEPQRTVFQTLCANVALAGLTNVHCHYGTVGEAAGEIVVPPIDYRQENNFGGLALGEFKQGEKVPVVTIDSLHLAACHFLKADVEGMELAVLRGAKATIEKFKPILYVENDRQEKSAALVQQIRELGYKLYWHRPPLFNPGNYFENRENIFGSVISANMLCIHSSVKASISGLKEVTE